MRNRNTLGIDNNEPACYTVCGGVMVKLKILVIDDDLFWRRLLARFFGSADYDVQAANSCGDGVRLAEKHRSDCILLDLHLKDGDGVDVSAAHMDGGQRPKFPVTIVSSDPKVELKAYTECRTAFPYQTCSPQPPEKPSALAFCHSGTGEKWAAAYNGEELRAGNNFCGCAE